MRRQRYKTAVGLTFDEKNQDQDAPTVSVCGTNINADLLVDIAKRYGVPVVEDPAMARTLSQLERDERIPPALYRSVAALLNYVRKRWRRP